MNKRGTLFVVTGPSGAGKGTVLKKVMAATDHLYFSISATTRAPRPGEVHGVHYHFITRESFAQLIREERLLEHAEYVGNFYGTPLDPVLEHLAQGDDVILEIEIQGAKQVKARYPEAALVFIAPPSFDELERRLRGRGTETEETILRRMDTARRECAHMDAFQYIVLNDTPENGAYELLSIITAHRCRRENRGFALK
ncbi:MAG: guanylate kinase [Clostridia bacterium]|nr:guanylate kinase [Clostridia bacterium]